MKTTRLLLSLLQLALAAAPLAAAEPSRWENDIAAFEKADRESPPRPGGVMLYGSSSFRLWRDVGAAFPGVPIVNRGFGGSELSDLVEHFERVVIPHAPRLLLIYGGDNDIANGKSAARVLADFRELVGKVRRHLPDTEVVFMSVKPSPSRERFLDVQREANDLVRRFAEGEKGVRFIDAATPLLDGQGRPDPKYFLDDRLHLNAAGYEAWRQVLAPLLRPADR